MYHLSSYFSRLTASLCWAIILFLAACDQSPEYLTIKGNLPKLPDGKMILKTRYPEVVIDSTQIRDGIFEFKVSAKDYPEPILVSLYYISPEGERKAFMLRTGFKGKAGFGGIAGADVFMLEDGIEINGPLLETRDSSIPILHTETPIRTGKQNRVWYSDTIGFEKLTSIPALQKQISLHPYSYHYLYSLERRMRHISKNSFYALFSRFEPAVRNGPTGKAMQEYIENRDQIKLTSQITLPDSNGTQQPILQNSPQLTMINLWASWCGPCRAEIPALKRLHEKFSGNSSFQIVSISVDYEKEPWIQAIQKEKMPWEQLMINSEISTYAKELFGYNKYIPLTLFVDREGNIIRKFSGFDKENEKAFEELIARHIATPISTKP